MKKIIANLNDSLFGIRLSLAGITLHDSDHHHTETNKIPTFKDDKISLKSDGDAIIGDFKKAVDEKMAECEF